MLLACAFAFALKFLGYVVPTRWLDGDRTTRVTSALPVALLAALVAVQRTGAGTPSRIHLDIETDDVPAEVARVVALGARVVEDRSEGYTILEDPGGLVFCVVPVQTGDRFVEDALEWD